MNKAILSNGITLYHLHTQHDPISACHVFIPGGTYNETKEKLGLTTLMWSLLLKGSKQRSARVLAEDIEGLGAHIGASASHDSSQISCHAVADYFPESLMIMKEVFLTPAFPEAEVAKEKIALLAAIRAKKENIFSVASETLSENLYKNHPYSYPITGTEKTVTGLTREDVIACHKTMLKPEQTLVAVASNHSFKEIKKLFEKVLGGPWGEKSKKTAAKKITPQPVFSHVQKKEQFEQAYLMMGVPAPAIGSTDFAALKLLASLLGGGMSSRLFQSLREKRGLAYDVGSYYSTRQKTASFVTYMGLQMSNLTQAREQILAELELIQREPVSKQELTHVKNYVKGTFILDHQTNSQRSYYLGYWASMGMGTDFDKVYIKSLDRVTPQTLQRVAKKYLGQKPSVIEIIPQNGRA